MELDSDLHLPPRKRLLAGFKRLNGSSSSSSTSNSNSNGSSSSASTEVQTVIISDSGFENQSQEELVEAARSAAALAVIKAKAARAKANEKALISAKAIAVAKRALELVDSFPQKNNNNNKLKKHVPLKVLYSKGLLRDEEEDLACRLQRAIDGRYPRVLRICSGFEEENGYGSKKQKIVVEDGSRSSMNEVVDSDCSYEELESNRKTSEADSDATLETEESNSFGKRGGLENGVSSALATPREDSVIPRSGSWKCQELKCPECVKQNKGVRSS